MYIAEDEMQHPLDCVLVENALVVNIFPDNSPHTEQYRVDFSEVQNKDINLNQVNDVEKIFPLSFQKRPLNRKDLSFQHYVFYEENGVKYGLPKEFKTKQTVEKFLHFLIRDVNCNVKVFAHYGSRFDTQVSTNSHSYITKHCN